MQNSWDLGSKSLRISPILLAGWTVNIQRSTFFFSSQPRLERGLSDLSVQAYLTVPASWNGTVQVHEWWRKHGCLPQVSSLTRAPFPDIGFSLWLLRIPCCSQSTSQDDTSESGITFRARVFKMSSMEAQLGFCGERMLKRPRRWAFLTPLQLEALFLSVLLVGFCIRFQLGNNVGYL